MVRLKEKTFWDSFLQKPYFNSNMVRLKGFNIKKTTREDEEFQFQYGSIKSRRETTAERVKKEFQFQYGSIKSI